MNTASIDVYPVGVLAELLRLRRAIRQRNPKMIRWALGRLRWQCRRIVRHARAGNWRDVKNAFNGYLAEPCPWPADGSLRRCGSGWTKRRALRSLRRHGYKTDVGMGAHHSTRCEVIPGVWDVARPLRDTSWWRRWRRALACRRETGHCWHPFGMIDWWCCMCGGETDGMPPQRCVHCAGGTAA